MGLTERRVLAAFQSGEFPGLKDRIEKAAGSTVPVNVAWDQLAIEGESHLYSECWRAIYFEPLIQALGSVARDEMGATALRDGLKQIVVRNVSGCAYPDCCAGFEGGVLTLDHLPTTNAADSEARARHIAKVLEKGL